MKEVFFTAVVITGGPPRPEKTIRAMKALNDQTFTGIQKILINNARPDEQIEELKLAGALTPDWEIITFEKSEYILGDHGSVWRVPGNRALDLAVGRYIFFQADDDFLANDFFAKMAALFEKHPDAVCGSGLPVSYYWETGKFKYPKDGLWQSRPSYESGLELIRKNFIGFYTMNPGFSLVMNTSMVQEVSESIFESGFPDFNCMYQVALRGMVIYDPTAEMYWGRHNGQDHYRWDFDHVISGVYRGTFDEIIKHNISSMTKFSPDSLSIQRELKRSFHTRNAQKSSEILFERLLQKLHLIPEPAKLAGKSIKVLVHLLNMCQAPGRAILTIWRMLRIAFRGSVEKLCKKITGRPSNKAH